MARAYYRDSRGRFASKGAGGAAVRGARLAKSAAGKANARQVMRAGSRTGNTLAKPRNLAPGSVKPRARKSAKVDLSQSAFERRARSAEQRAKVAERVVAGADRAYASPGTKRAFRTADALRSAADSYSSIVRRSKSPDSLGPASLFNQRGRYSTAPKLSRSEKAARTRSANKAKRQQEQIRLMENARRYGR